MSTQNRRVVALGQPWRGVGPFIFANRHVDAYPAGDGRGGPAGGVGGRALGADFNNPSGWSMYHGDEVPGFPAHPHRGFETITLVQRGYVDHADSTGAGARYGAGDVQWVTAGNGVSHSEMFPLLNTDADNPFELYQIWLNLPAASKSAAPEFTMQWREDIPVVTPRDSSGEVSVQVIAGRYDDVDALAPPTASWAANPDADVALWLINLGPNSSVTLPATASDATERMLYIHGEGAAVTVDGHRLADGDGYYQRDTEALTVTTAAESALVLVLQGVPIDEPLVARGPFVMNSEAEIMQAYEDYRRTQFGGWPWPSTAPVYDLDSPRFAQHGDGRLEHPAGAR